MRPIRVLIVDDMILARKMLTEALSSDPSLEVVGTAPNGSIALAKIPQVTPDIVILDVEMPEMDGLGTLKEIRKKYPYLPVVMFSSLTKRGAVVTLEALTLGANDYITKPENVASAAMALQQIKDNLIPRIKVFCQPFLKTQEASSLDLDKSPSVQVLEKLPPRETKAYLEKAEIIAIGVSTGGPTALAEIFLKLPGNLPVPIVMVQHMPPIFTKTLAEHLTTKSAVRVDEAVHGMRLLPGRAYLAPGDYHMELERDPDGIYIVLNQKPSVNSCRPSVDILFHSVADIFKSKTFAVVLTGMGEDGLSGCKRIHELGGRIIVQDEATSVVWGMPGVVAKAGIAESIFPLNEIALGIVEVIKKNRVIDLSVRATAIPPKG